MRAPDDPVEEEPETHTMHGRFYGDNTRFLVLLVTSLCLTSVYVNFIAFNFTMICMEDVVEEHVTRNVTDVHWLNSSVHVNGLMAALSLGSILGTIPLMALNELLGLRVTMTIYAIASSVATFMLPFAVAYNYFTVFFVRVIQGTSIGMVFLATGSVTRRWSSVAKTTTYLALLSSHQEIATAIGMSSSALLCSNEYSWRYLYLVLGLISASLSVVFFCFYKDHPTCHKNVSCKELSEITRDKREYLNRTIPWMDMFRTRSVLSLFLSCIGGFLGIHLFVFYGPMYIHQIQEITIVSRMFETAIPFVIATVIKFALGPLADLLKMVPEKFKLMFFTIGSQSVLAGCLIGLSVSSKEDLLQIFYVIAVVASSLHIIGSIKLAQLIAQHHVHVMLAIMALCGCISSFLLPAAVSGICPNNTNDEWSVLFICLAIVIILSNIPLMIYIDCRPADWTKQRPTKRKSLQLEGSTDRPVVVFY